MPPGPSESAGSRGRFCASARWMRRSTSRTASRYWSILPRSAPPSFPRSRLTSSPTASRMLRSSCRSAASSDRSCRRRRTAARTGRAGGSPSAAALLVAPRDRVEIGAAVGGLAGAHHFRRFQADLERGELRFCRNPVPRSDRRTFRRASPRLQSSSRECPSAKRCRRGDDRPRFRTRDRRPAASRSGERQHAVLEVRERLQDRAQFKRARLLLGELVLQFMMPFGTWNQPKRVGRALSTARAEVMASSNGRATAAPVPYKKVRRSIFLPVITLAICLCSFVSSLDHLERLGLDDIENDG